MRRLEIARCLLAERHLGRLVGLVAPHGERHVLSVHGWDQTAVGKNAQDRTEARTSDRDSQAHDPTSLLQPRSVSVFGVNLGIRAG